MINSKDKNLEDLTPNISWDEFKTDIEYMINEPDFHSDEVSETDVERSKSERRLGVRPKSKKTTDSHVIHVIDKPWRSRRVSSYYFTAIFIIPG